MRSWFCFVLSGPFISKKEYTPKGSGNGLFRNSSKEHARRLNGVRFTQNKNSVLIRIAIPCILFLLTWKSELKKPEYSQNNAPFVDTGIRQINERHNSGQQTNKQTLFSLYSPTLASSHSMTSFQALLYSPRTSEQLTAMRSARAWKQKKMTINHRTPSPIKFLLLFPTAKYTQISYYTGKILGIHPQPTTPF